MRLAGGGAMKINGEPVELVTDFASLQTGMSVWISPCHCGSKHRFILLNPAPAIRQPWGRAFVALPHPNCRQSPEPTARVVVSEWPVRERLVYAVINPLNARTTERKREAVRT